MPPATLPPGAGQVLTRDISGPREATERAKTAQYIAFVQGCFAISLISGMSQFTHKWHPAIELGRNSDAFRELGLPAGHFGFIYSDAHELMWKNATMRRAHLVDCDAAGHSSFDPPCYPGMHQFVVHIGFFTLVCPVLPVLVAMLQILHEHRNDKADAEKRVRGMFSNKEGRRGMRFLTYLVAVVFLQVWTIGKTIVEGPRPPFDPSDTICCFFSCGAIAMREVAHIVHSEAPGKMVIVGLVSILTAAQLYYVFFTAKYFHLPAEVFAGGAIGVTFSFIFVYLTTLPVAMERIFPSTKSKCHHNDQPLLA